MATMRFSAAVTVNFTATGSIFVANRKEIAPLFLPGFDLIAFKMPFSLKTRAEKFSLPNRLTSEVYE